MSPRPQIVPFFYYNKKYTLIIKVKNNVKTLSWIIPISLFENDLSENQSFKLPVAKLRTICIIFIF